jgi:hypothetical protein
MKPIAIFVLVAAVSLMTVAASARTGTAPGTADERVIAQVAGPPAAAVSSKERIAASSRQSAKAVLKKAKIKQKPPFQDPN